MNVEMRLDSGVRVFITKTSDGNIYIGIIDYDGEVKFQDVVKIKESEIGRLAKFLRVFKS